MKPLRQRFGLTIHSLNGLLAAVLAGIIPGGAQDGVELWRQVQDLVRAGEVDGLVEVMSAEAAPEEAAARYADVVRSLYAAKDLPAVVLVAQRGIDYALARAEDAERTGSGDPALLRAQAKELAYNLASYTWPGWDEPGIAIRTVDLEAGFAAARLNLRLAEALARGPEPMANAHFLLGGHALAAENYNAARQSFREFGDIARSAGLRELAILAEGYLVITEAAAGSGNPGTYVLEPVRVRFREAFEDGADFWIDQLDTAWRIFVTG